MPMIPSIVRTVPHAVRSKGPRCDYKVSSFNSRSPRRVLKHPAPSAHPGDPARTPGVPPGLNIKEPPIPPLKEAADNDRISLA